MKKAWPIIGGIALVVLILIGGAIYSTALEYLWNGIIKVAMYAWDNMIYFIIGIAAVCAIVYIVKLNKKKALGK